MIIGKGTKIWHPELSNIQNCEIGEDCKIHSHVWIGNNVKIGNRVKIQAFAFIPDGVIIENDCFIGPRVTFTNDRNMDLRGKEHWQKTIVRQGAKIGASATIIAGVTIGERAKIGAGSVVTKDIPSDIVACGVPAKIKAGKRS